ncbi:transglutaminase family protein [Nocardioidaceae bacterium]|nr:transglutaminase family protein [Nocardioidaceae bacterium]
MSTSSETAMSTPGTHEAARQLRVVHTTGFGYTGEVEASFNEARMTPISGPDQLTVLNRVEISPAAWTQTYTDYWGSAVTAFEVNEVHRELTVTATSTVRVARTVPEAVSLSWEDLADRDLRETHVELLQVEETCEPHPELAQRADALRQRTATPGEFAAAVCELVHEEVEYVTGSTDVQTKAAEAWEHRQGVCQDIAHLVLGVLRSHGVPARYVSGYLHPDPDAGVGVQVAGESHAWIEWWDGAWVAYDPTNASPVTNSHIEIAHGRWYADVAPLRGIFAGAETADMFVEVAITRLS